MAEVHGLGFVRYQCPEEEPIANLIEEQEIDEALFDSMVEDMPKTVYTADTSLNVAVVSVIAVPTFFIGIILGLAVCCFGWCIVAKVKSVKNQKDMPHDNDVGQ